MTKIFCDIADINLIKKFDRKKIVKGFTTNPSLMRKAGAKDYQNYSKKILKDNTNKIILLKTCVNLYVFKTGIKNMIKKSEINNINNINCLLCEK